MENTHEDELLPVGVTRRRNRMLLGWFYNKPDTQVLETPNSIRHIVFNIVALNVRTLRALQDGWYGSLQIIGRCCDEYQGFLSQEEVELLDWLTQNGGSRFNTSVSEYVTPMPLRTAMKYLMDPQTSELYAQLIDISLKKYRAAQAHAIFTSRIGPENIQIPKQYDYCESVQKYIEATAVEEQETRNFLNAALNGAKQLLYSIKVAVDDGCLEKEHLVVLKLKLLALQEYYPDACTAIYGEARDLFDPKDKNWWDARSLVKTYPQGYKSPANEVRAYTEAESHIPLLSFFVPVLCIVSCIPMGFAWTHSDMQSGRAKDPDFYQLIAGSILQLLSLATLVYPTVFHARLARLPWLLTWILVAISASCTLSSIPLYLLSPTAWSMVTAFSGSISQALILLQIVHAI